MAFRHQESSAMNVQQASLEDRPHPIEFNEFVQLDENVKYNIYKTLEAREKAFQLQMQQRNQQLVDYQREIEQSEYEKQQLKQSLKEYQRLLAAYQKGSVSNRSQ